MPFCPRSVGTTRQGWSHIYRPLPPSPPPDRPQEVQTAGNQSTTTAWGVFFSCTVEERGYQMISIEILNKYPQISDGVTLPLVGGVGGFTWSPWIRHQVEHSPNTHPCLHDGVVQGHPCLHDGVVWGHPSLHDGVVRGHPTPWCSPGSR